QSKIPDEFNSGCFVGTPGRDTHSADGNPLSSAFDELLPEFIGRPFGERPLFVGCRPIQQCAVLCNDSIKQFKPWKNLDQVVEFPAGNENEFAAGFTECFKREDRGFTDCPIPGNRAVVVACQG